MDKKHSEQITSEVLIADILLRLTTLERLLISKGILSDEEFKSKMNEIAAQIAKTIIQKSNIQGDLDKIVEDLQGNTNKNIKN